MKTAREVTIFEMGPRDGLQNEHSVFTLADKLKLIQGLASAGLREIEIGAFVRPDRVPQMADTDQVYAALQNKKLKLGKARAWALVPNLKGLELAHKSGANAIAVFGAATESFSQNNIGMSIAESHAVFRDVVKEARRRKMKVRGYVSTVYGCPFEGKTPPKAALKALSNMMSLGVDQISVGDTIGVATPKDVELVLKPFLRKVPASQVAVHFHDTRGTALANTLYSLSLGIKNVDSSAGGLGGCPFAPGAAGNLATEDLVYMLHGMGVKTGIDLDKVCEVSLAFHNRFQEAHHHPHGFRSKYLQAYAANRK